MNKVNRKKQKNEKGFTMIELIIVVAIMGIIGAVLVPMFGNMSTKARLTSDITSVKTLQRQLDVFRAETGEYPAGFAALNDTAVGAGVIGELVSEHYLDAKDLVEATGGFELKLQTDGTLLADDGRCYLSFATTSVYADVITELDDEDGNSQWAQIAP
jgi:prepilin-type N-terminal cleavage/methylation domain-containing protein